MFGYWCNKECSVNEKNIGASYCTISAPLGRRPQPVIGMNS